MIQHRMTRKIHSLVHLSVSSGMDMVTVCSVRRIIRFRSSTYVSLDWIFAFIDFHFVHENETEWKIEFKFKLENLSSGTCFASKEKIIKIAYPRTWFSFPFVLTLDALFIISSFIVVAEKENIQNDTMFDGLTNWRTGGQQKKRQEQGRNFSCNYVRPKIMTSSQNRHLHLVQWRRRRRRFFFCPRHVFLSLCEHFEIVSCGERKTVRIIVSSASWKRCSVDE